MKIKNRAYHVYVVTGLSIFFLAIFCFVAFRGIYHQIDFAVSDSIVTHVERLGNIFKEINATAGIIGFEHEKNYIDFLTVKNFVGSEVGSMNLRKPKEWRGPYLKDNLTMQEKYYVVIVSDYGWYIAPGDGVVLSNKKVIGKDIILNAKTDLEVLVENGLLKHKGKPLVCKIN